MAASWLRRVMPMRWLRTARAMVTAKTAQTVRRTMRTMASMPIDPIMSTRHEGLDLSHGSGEGRRLGHGVQRAGGPVGRLPRHPPRDGHLGRPAIRAAG